MNKILTQFKRELWESRTGLIRAPWYLAALVLVLVLFGLIAAQRTIGNMTLHISTKGAPNDDWGAELMRLLASGDLFNAHPELLSMALAALYMIFILVFLLVQQSYLLGCLYSDRRDQSILFWKSLPVSERQNVLTKLGTATLSGPLSYAAAALATGAAYLVLLMAYAGLFLNLALPGFGRILGAYLGSIAGLVVAWLLLALWALPIFCWMMLCSAWAKKAPFLLALGVPLVLMVVEFWVLGSAHLGHAIKGQIHAALAPLGEVLSHPGRIGVALGDALGAPAFWGGLLIGGLFLAGCVWLRNDRYEI